MTTLQAIGFTCAGGTFFAAVAFVWFGVAVKARSVNVAPRASARDRDVIYNPNARRGKGQGLCCRRGKQQREDTKKNDDANADASNENNGPLPTDVENRIDPREIFRQTREQVQFRGGPFFGWIPWVLSFSYKELLEGVPGTGTRKHGMEGSMLKVNLDGIILIRFHALCLRVAFVATLFGVGVILPLNFTAQCFTEEDKALDKCTEIGNYTLTNFEQTTIHNVAELKIYSDFEGNGDADNSLWAAAIFGSSGKLFDKRSSYDLGRLYATVVFSWLLIWYTIRLMKKEWVDALAMRRVYYLEGTHWENRVAELNETSLNVDDSDDEEDEVGEEERPGAIARRRRINKRRKARKAKTEEAPRREAFLPHPEQRETVPNIELYSVLVGNIPSLPSEVAESEDLHSMGLDKHSMGSIDWQLAVTSTFFDQCVPNQPGFSSSVAAVTILPSAPKLALAWRMWYKHVGLLRRLRFVRSLIAERRHYEIDEMEHEEEIIDTKGSKKQLNPNAPLGEGESLDAMFGSLVSNNPVRMTDQNESRPDFKPEEFVDLSVDHDNDILAEQIVMKKTMSTRISEEDKRLQQRIDYYNDVFGSKIDDEGELQNTLLVHALSYGPEQTAVYSREFAQGAAACCPNGCREGRMRTLSLIQLEEIEEEIKRDVEDSFEDLSNAQKSNLTSDRDLQLDTSARRGSISAERNKLDSVEEGKDIDPDDIEARLYSQTPKKFHGDDDFAVLEKNGNGFGESSVNSNFLPDELGSDVSTRFILTNQGKVIFRDSNTAYGSQFGDDNSVPHSNGGISNPGRIPNVQPQMTNENENFQYQPSRRRLNTNMSQISATSILDPWQRVQEMVKDDEGAKGISKDDRRHIASGAWKCPSIRRPITSCYQSLTAAVVDFFRSKTADVVENFASESTYAIVTFTSRQAAIAARHCLADGRGTKRWRAVEDIPVPPLADAAAGDLKTCRGCCRPVTLTINGNQQFLRKYTALLLLCVMFIFYTIPLTLASSLVAPEKLNEIIPGIKALADDNPIFNKLLSGIIPAGFYSLFFALCPVIFRCISNSGSNAISVNQAEYIALQYYWFFMIMTAFSGTFIATTALNYLNSKRGDDTSFASVLRDIAGTLPTQVSATWLNWIIFRTLLILPLGYMIQSNVFAFQWLGWKCCRRCAMGGGPGGPIPYRIYIDSGMVFMCIVVLAPVSPLVAPAALLYFLYCAPLWRRNCIYVYRPKFDTGGLRWPFLADVLISSMILAQVLLTTVMALKEAVGPAALSALPIIVIILYRRSSRKQYLRSYLDAALLQTFSLDGWDNTVPTSAEKREEYRKFLVDAHKAAYVPICIAGGSTAALTAEPALVVPHENDVLLPIPMDAAVPSDVFNNVNGMPEGDMNIQLAYSYDRSPGQGVNGDISTSIRQRAKSQVGASVRRLRQSVPQFNYAEIPQIQMSIPDTPTFSNEEQSHVPTSQVNKGPTQQNTSLQPPFLNK